MIEWVYSDGGRELAGMPRGNDCAVRSIAIATQLPYKCVWEALHALTRHPEVSSPRRWRNIRNSSYRTGFFLNTYSKFLKDLGWSEYNLEGEGVTIDTTEHMPGRLIVQLKNHLTCILDGVVYDTHDCTQEGKREVRGFFKQAPYDHERSSVLIG